MLKTTPIADLSDAALIAAFAERGDQPAFAELVRRHGPMVVQVCRQILGADGQGHVEDAAQAVFLTLARKAKTLTGGKSVGGWLHLVARHVALAARRASRTRERHEKEAAKMANVRPVLEESVDIEALHGAIAKLPADYREVIVRHFFEGQSHEEISRELGVATGTIASRISRAKDQLAQRLGGQRVTLAGMVAAPISASMLAGLAGTTSAAGLPTTVTALSDHALAAVVGVKWKVAAAATAFLAVAASVAVVVATGQLGGRAPTLMPVSVATVPAATAPQPEQLRFVARGSVANETLEEIAAGGGPRLVIAGVHRGLPQLATPFAVRFKAVTAQEFMEALAKDYGQALAWSADGRFAVMYQPAAAERLAALKTELASPDATVRRNAALAARWTTDVRLAPALVKLALEDDLAVAARAKEALRQLGWSAVLAMAPKAWDLLPAEFAVSGIDPTERHTRAGRAAIEMYATGGAKAERLVARAIGASPACLNLVAFQVLGTWRESTIALATLGGVRHIGKFERKRVGDRDVWSVQTLLAFEGKDADAATRLLMDVINAADFKPAPADAYLQRDGRWFATKAVAHATGTTALSYLREQVRSKDVMQSQAAMQGVAQMLTAGRGDVAEALEILAERAGALTGRDRANALTCVRNLRVPANAKGEAVLRQLEKLAADKNADMRAAAVAAMTRALRGGLPQEQVLKALQRAAVDAQPDVRVAAAEGLSRLAGSGVETLRTLAEDKNATVARTAARRLTELECLFAGDRALLDANLIDELFDKKGQNRTGGARALLLLSRGYDVQRVLSQMDVSKLMAVEDDNALKAIAGEIVAEGGQDFETLIDRGVVFVVGGMRPDGSAFSGDDVAERAAMKKTLLAERGVKATDVVFRALADERTVFRRVLVEFLGNVHTEAAFRVLLKNLPESDDAQRERILVSLGGFEQSTATLLELAEKAPARDMPAVAKAMGQIGTDAMRDALVKRLEREPSLTRRVLPAMACYWPSDAAVQRLLRTALRADDAVLRQAAVWGLSYDGSKPALEALLERMPEEQDRHVLRNIVSVVARLDAQKGEHRAAIENARDRIEAMRQSDRRERGMP